MKASLNILLLEDCEDDAVLLEQQLKRAGCAARLRRVWSREQMTSALFEQNWDVILSDYTMPAFDGLDGLAVLKESGLDIPFILVSGTIGEERAVAAMKAGASDFLVKGDWTRLIPAIERELQDAQDRLCRRDAEKALKSAEANFRTLVENSIAGIYVIQQNKLVYANPTVCEILGYSMDELIARPLVDFVVPEERALVEENVRKRLQGAVNSIRYSLRMVRKNGTIAQLEAHGASTFYNGKPSILGILMDQSSHKEAEDRFSRMFNASPIGITLSSCFTGSILEANDAFLSLIDREREGVIGRCFSELTLWANPGDEERILAEFQQRGRIENRELAIRGKSKETIHVLLSAERVEVGGQPRTLAFFHDITERKRMETQFLRNQRMESIGTLAGGIAHDLNNALAPILMSSQLLRFKFSDPEILRILDVVEASAQRGAGMVKQVLTFARGIEGKHGSVQVKHLVRDLLAMMNQTFPKAILLRDRVARDLWPITGDATQLHQVLLNLCINARDAMPNGGTLTLAAANVCLDDAFTRLYPEARPGPYVVLSVEDSGIGMPPQVRERVFEPFFTTKEQGKGTGLGLPTVRSIVKNHNGFLTFDTVEKKGTQFRVYLPAGAVESALTEGAHPVLPVGNGEWILVVDDEAMVRDIASQMLQSFGYHVLTAANGAEAVATCAKHAGKIRVMVTDLAMPIMDGAAAIEAVRTIDPNVRAIVASGSTLESVARHGEASLSVRAIIEKPYTPEKLLTTIHAVLHEEAGPKV